MRGKGGTTLWAVDDHDPNRANIASLVAREPTDPNLAHQIDAERRSAAGSSPCTGSSIRDVMRASDLSSIPERTVGLFNDGTEARGDLVFSQG